MFAPFVSVHVLRSWSPPERPSRSRTGVVLVVGKGWGLNPNEK